MYYTVVTLVICLQQVYGQNKLGLVIKNRELQLAKGEQKRQVDITVYVSKTYPDYLPSVNQLRDHLKTIKAIPGLSNTTTQYQEIGHMIVNIEQEINLIELGLKSIINFMNPTNTKTASTQCTLGWPNYDPNLIENLVKELDIIIAGLKTDSTSATLASSRPEYQELVTTLGEIRSTILMVSQKVLARVNLLEILSNGKLDPEVLTGIQAIGCVPLGEMENSKVLGCEKTNTGLLCTLEVGILENKIKAVLYTLVNYNGVQLDLNGTDYLVNIDNKWKRLSCIEDLDKSLDSYDNCVQKEWNDQCGAALGQEKLDSYIKHCTFVKKEPILTEIVEEGILVQGTNLEIELLIDLMDHRPTRIYQKTPLLISTGKLVRVRQGEYEETAYPRKGVSTDQIITSWLTPEDIRLLEKQVHDSVNLDLEDYLEITGGAFLLILSVLVGVIFKRHKNMSTKLGTEPREMLLGKGKARKNLKENKRIQYL
jgi:hypothetical protein